MFSVAEISEKLTVIGNTFSDHTVGVDPEQLIGPQVIDMILKKTGMIKLHNFIRMYVYICTVPLKGNVTLAHIVLLNKLIHSIKQCHCNLLN